MGDLESPFLGAISSLPKGEHTDVLRALERAKEWHAGQVRDSGEPYVQHPIATAEYLASVGAGRDMLVAALLHDAVEDGHASLQEVEREFGETVSTLVDGVTKLSKSQFEGRRGERQLASLRKMILTANDDLRVILIKLADRLHNVRTIGALRPEKQQRIALETLEIYVPFARFVGWWEVKERCEAVCFPIAYPQECAIWHEAIAQVRARVEAERMAFVQQVNGETAADIEAQLTKMTDYEIFQKLHRVLVDVEHSSHIDSILLVVRRPSPIECYRVLGEIHAQHQVRIGSIRDYIATPQPNGYQALHTMIFLSPNHEIRLRIQTAEMQEYSFKRKVSSWEEAKARDADVFRALRTLHEFSLDDQRFFHHLKQSVLGRRITVFTTSGETITLPEGATGVDFAYEAEPQNVKSLAGIRVDGSEVYEATRALKEGETVELVLSSNGEGVKKSLWMEKVKSVRAQEDLRHSLLQSSRVQRHQEGRDLLEQECIKRKLPTWWLFHIARSQRKLADRLQASSFDALLESVGTGEVPAGAVADAYRGLVFAPSHWAVWLLQVFHLLPRERVLDPGASLVDIEVTTIDRPGMIYGLSKCFAERNINMAKFSVFAMPGGEAFYRIRLEVKNFEQFSDLFDALLQVPGVKKILRKK